MRAGRIAPWAFGGAVALFAWLTGNSAVFPSEHWELVAVAAGLRPPSAPLPGLWLNAASWLFRAVGLDAGLAVLRALGPVGLGALAALAWRFFDETLPETLRARMRRKGWSRRVVAAVLAQGVLFFVLSDPVWKAGRYLSPTLFLLLPTLLAARLFLRALRGESGRAATVFAAVCGLLAADTPLAFAGLAGFAGVMAWRYAKAGDVSAEGFANPLVRFVLFRRMAVAFLVCLAAGVAADAAWFMGHEGLEAQGWNALGYALHHLHAYALAAYTAARPLGWLVIALVAAGPAVLAVLLVGRATDDDRFLPYVPGLVFAGTGLLGFAQSAGWPPFWFWRWPAGPDLVRSDYLLCVCLLATSLTALLALCVFGVEVYFRNNRRLAQVRYQDAAEGSAAGAAAARSLRIADRAARALVVCEPILCLAALLPLKFDGTERAMASVVNDAAEQTAAECGGAAHLFTDGALDAAVEVAAARQGRALKVVSMMSGGAPYAQYLRARGEADEEDREMLRAGAAHALRTWVRNKPARAADLAVQIGFELWRHDGLPQPACGGLVARTAGFPEGEAEAWAAKARALGARALAAYGAGDPDGVPNPALRALFTFAQWRIGRMCRMRADAADARQDAEAALADAKLADDLDAKNAAFARVRGRMDWLGFQSSAYVTPREGLAFWLDRADFRMARVYAERVLRTEPKNASANFAMGMGHYLDGQYARAEVYLRRSVAAHPGSPAARNNLAVVQARLGRWAEAETNALEALALKPDAPEIKSTLDHIRASQAGGK